MRIIFCRDSLEPSRPDRGFQDEVEAVERLGLSYELVDYDALMRGDSAARVVRGIQQEAEASVVVYRGWMMSPEQYQSGVTTASFLPSFPEFPV